MDKENVMLIDPLHSKKRIKNVSSEGINIKRNNFFSQYLLISNFHLKLRTPN